MLKLSRCAKIFMLAVSPVVLAIALMGCQTVSPTEVTGFRSSYPRPHAPAAQVTKSNGHTEQSSLRRPNVRPEDRLRREAAAIRWRDPGSGGTGLIIGVGF